jgi:hypothetical protein
VRSATIAAQSQPEEGPQAVPQIAALELQL